MPGYRLLARSRVHRASWWRAQTIVAVPQPAIISGVRPRASQPLPWITSNRRAAAAAATAGAGTAGGASRRGNPRKSRIAAVQGGTPRPLAGGEHVRRAGGAPASSACLVRVQYRYRTRDTRIRAQLQPLPSWLSPHSWTRWPSTGLIQCFCKGLRHNCWQPRLSVQSTPPWPSFACRAAPSA